VEGVAGQLKEFVDASGDLMALDPCGTHGLVRMRQPGVGGLCCSGMSECETSVGDRGALCDVLGWCQGALGQGP